MVEVALVHVEAVDAYRHVVAALLLVVGRLGVHHPLVARCRDVHLACRRHEVCRQFQVDGLRQVVLVVELQSQVLVVERLAGIHLNLLGHDLTRVEGHRVARSVECVAAEHDAGAVLVLAVGGAQREQR